MDKKSQWPQLGFTPPSGLIMHRRGVYNNIGI
jgi:hypothetical protein